MSSITGFLRIAWIYQLYQWLAGSQNYKKLLANNYICYQAGQKILDIGCGPADILKFLPDDTNYTGIDMNSGYIKNAGKCFPDKKFICGDITSPEFQVHEESYDTIFMVGLLHHLPDEKIRSILNIIYHKLKPGGRIIALEPVYSGKQGLIEKWFMKNDRGKFIRKTEEYESLINLTFKENSIEIFSGIMHIPFTLIILTGIKR